MEHSTYTSAFHRTSPTYASKRCSTSKFYYQALQIDVAVSGRYSIWSRSSLNIHGFLYRDAFDPIDPSLNLIERDSGSCGDGQFRLYTSLQKNITYILVVTPLDGSRVGLFSIFTVGAGNTTFARLDFSSTVQSTYSSELNTGSATYLRERCGKWTHHYEAVQINVSTSGEYGFSSSSSGMATSGYLYRDTFDALDPSLNQIASDYDSCGNEQFQFRHLLQRSSKYILVMASSYVDTKGTISVVTIGGGNATFTRLSRFDLPSIVQSAYSSTHDKNSETYSRERCGTSTHFYQPLRIHISVSGEYRFSSSSSVGTYGYLYRDMFDPLNPSRNRIPNDDDDGCTVGQFWLRRFLHTSISYILIVATPVSTGSGAAFTITTAGAAGVNFTRLSKCSLRPQEDCLGSRAVLSSPAVDCAHDIRIFAQHG